jgi:carboxyl-terminal processing protease
MRHETGSGMTRLTRAVPYLMAALLAWMAAALPQPVFAQAAQAADPAGPAMESFVQVWTAIRDTHWQERPGGLDWQAIRTEFEPRIAAAQNRTEVRSVLSEMLARLGQSHFGIIPATVYSDLGSGRGGEQTTGIDVRLLGNDVVVTEVAAGSPAEAAGVKPGWVLVRVGGRDMGDLIERFKAAAASRGLKLGLVLASSLQEWLSGPEGATIPATFLDGNDAAVELQLPTAPPRGTPIQFGNLPTIRVWYEDRRYGDTTYIRFNVFLDVPRIMARFEQSVRGCDPCDGIIVDLRGNAGGIAAMAMGMSGFFTSEHNFQLGTMYMRGAELKMVVNPRPNPFEGPLAILVDGASASTAEFFAGGLQDLGRARIFGTPSAGAALPSVIERLPNGDGFQHAIADYVSASGRELEGDGVTPDEVVTLDRQALLRGADPVLDAALRWIAAQ